MLVLKYRMFILGLTLVFIYKFGKIYKKKSSYRYEKFTNSKKSNNKNVMLEDKVLLSVN